jgi:hypothetical protein
MSWLVDLLPTWFQLAGLLAVLAAAAAAVLIGRLARCGRGFSDTAGLCGWGLVIFAYTAVGTLSTVDLRLVVWLSIAVALYACRSTWLAHRAGERHAIWGSNWKIYLLGAPFLLVAAAKYPSEADVLSHWMFNAKYLLDNGTLPHPGLPASIATYPGFPYNHTFAIHFASVIVAGFADNAGFIINIGLVLLYAALLARLLQHAELSSGAHAGAVTGAVPVGWGLSALAIILATYANPIFARKIVLMANPDTATSVCLAFLGFVGWQMVEQLRAGKDRVWPWGLQFSALALLFVNMKQPNIMILGFLFAAMAFCTLVYAPRPWKRLAVWAPAMLGPAILSLVLWRYYLGVVDDLKEARLLPFAQWQFENIPAILHAMYANVIKKAGYFAIMFALTGWALWRLRRPGNAYDRLVILAAGVFVGWNAFLFFLYFAHWTGHASTGASSYWRYNTFIGYFGHAVIVYGIARLFWHGRLRGLVDVLGRLGLHHLAPWRGSILVVIAVALPLVTAPYLRFDLEEPKPFLRKVGLELAATLPAGARVLVHFPGDLGDYAAVMRYFANRDRLDMHVSPAPRLSDIIQDIEKQKDRKVFVWVMCARPDLERFIGRDLPAGTSVLLAQQSGGWVTRKQWPHPPPSPLVGYHKNISRTLCDLSKPVG